MFVYVLALIQAGEDTPEDLKLAELLGLMAPFKKLAMSHHLCEYVCWCVHALIQAGEDTPEDLKLAELLGLMAPFKKLAPSHLVCEYVCLCMCTH